MDEGKRTIREPETSQWIRGKGKSDCPFSPIHCDVSPSLIFLFRLSIVMSLLLSLAFSLIHCDVSTSQWIKEKGQSEKERHHNG
jgi:hypothetical protein